MKERIKYIAVNILIVFMLVACKNRSNANNQNTPTTKISTEATDSLNVELYPTLPVMLKEYISQNLPEYSFLTRKGELQDYEKDILEVNPHPFFAQGDFNGDGKTDYVILMNDGLKRLKIITFNSVQDSYTTHFIDHYLLQYYDQYKNSIQISLNVRFKGEYQAVDEKIFFKNDFFSIAYSDDSRTISYRWNNNNYEKVLFD